MEKVDNLGQGLRQGMRCLASGVCVITGLSKEGERCAMTASSVTSVSNEPPSLLVCIHQNAKMDVILSQSDDLAVSVLAASQQGISEACSTADLGDERFDVGSWQIDSGSGLSYVDSAPAVFICKKQKVVNYGTHSIYIADITGVMLANSKQKALVYADGGYHHL